MATVPDASARLVAGVTNILFALDDELGDDFSQPARLLYIEPKPDGEKVEVGVKVLPPGMHPLDELVGFAAPDTWWALGVVSHGWATRMGQRTRSRIRAVHAVTRDAGEVGGFRFAAGRLELQETAIGSIPDALRRAMGLPSDPPTFPVAELIAAEWLDALADGTASVDDPLPVLPPSWDAVRWEVITGARRLPDISATVAAWMDEGMFARWARCAYPRTADQLAGVRRVVDRNAYKAIKAVLKGWRLTD
jgi:hypothetical protein